MPRQSQTDDPAALDRFVAAQEDSHDIALAELTRGRKQSHWMWFIFPQLRGLGQSSMARHYGIADLDEARRYLAHPVLGPRLLACARAVLAHEDSSAEGIFGSIDAAKLRSSATLFAGAGGGEAFERILQVFFDGQPCPVTTERVRKDRASEGRS
ncbi:DUF1810 domain-containing protein [Paracoccus liaowanqingii]|uniref:DUF1810 domain-containing protein n=1 Tax=Paracoccus liaowanqingii TaxID=2560053 RepID=A0A4Z1BJN9_9RHOB|nr:DUF1810 domain-containing protein [Paracoccus liaowanqingii]TGN57828.1 DUF1810 domain-containing protein [Paracoccus liaowanqingii]